MSNECGLIHHPSGKPLRLRNLTCAYCGVLFGPHVMRTKEHVIARNFVPDVDFSSQWNLIVNACESCNGAKSDIEGELSALTMQPDLYGRHVDDDERLAHEAERGLRAS